jgi:outer membrane protein, heavy metal efflux system
VRCAIALLVLAACVPDLPRPRSWVQNEVAHRTGASLRSHSNRDFVVPAGLRLDHLGANEAVAIALWNNAAFQAELEQLGFARADLADAGVLPNPVVTLLFPISPKQLELTAKQGLGALWQRPSKVAAARADAARVAGTLVQRALDLARDTRIAHTNLATAERIVLASREASAIWDRLLEIADTRLRTGDASRREREMAFADSRASHLAADQALRDRDIAVEVLRALLGAPEAARLTVEPAVPPAELQGRAVWLRLAVESRPDLDAAKQAIEAAAERGGLERRRIVELVGILDINGNGPEIGPGIELPLPIFDQRQAGRIRARAELERASWQYIAVRRTIVQELATAHLRATQASKSLGAWTQEVLPARLDAQRLAQQGFQAGEESHAVVLEATRALIDARLHQTELEAELLRAMAELERAAGGRLAR